MKQLVSSVILFILFLSSCKTSPPEPVEKHDDQFVQIYFKYNFKDEVNTFENTLQKDLIADGVIKIKFWFTKEEQNSILQKAEKINYFSFQDTFKYIPKDSVSLYISPNPGEQVLRIKYQNKDKTTIWTYPIIENNKEFDALLELRQLIISIIESKPEYKDLPEPKGVYN